MAADGGPARNAGPGTPPRHHTPTASKSHEDRTVSLRIEGGLYLRLLNALKPSEFDHVCKRTRGKERFLSLATSSLLDP
mgnify:CR=1 FL=1